MRVRGPTLTNARALRQSLTNAETILWSRLKSRQLSGWRFRRQHPVGIYITDFACIEARLIVEVDGDTHASDQARQYDALRTQFIEGQGWRLQRFWNAEVFRNLDAVLNTILRDLPPPDR